MIRVICAVAIANIFVSNTRSARPEGTYTRMFDIFCLLGGSVGILLTYVWPKRRPAALRQAILDGRTPDVRRIVGEDPSALGGRTWEKCSALDLARSKSDAWTEVVLVRLQAPGSDEVTDWSALLRRYLDQLIHRLAAASWVGGVEFDLWRTAVGGAPLNEEQDPHGFSRLDAETVEDLKFLVRRANGWFAWDGKRGEATFVAREEWVRRYVLWRDAKGIEDQGRSPPRSA